jgi:hypothetical protein
MAETTITNLPNAAALTGAERVPMDQGGTTVDATTGAIAATLPEATTSTAGKLSAVDKTKLDSITADQATIVRRWVRNETGSTIAKGIPVYISVSNGVTPTIIPADASTEETAARTIGLTQAAINHQAYGWVIEVGRLDGINTSTLTEGQIIWLSETTGQMTTTRPTQPAHGVILGYCVKQGAGTSGIVDVKVDNGLELAELHDVLLTGAATDDVLSLAADGLWKKRTLGSAAAAATTDFAPAAQGVTNGNSHNHDDGDGAQIAYSSLSGLPTLGGAASLSVGTTAGTVAAGDAPTAAIAGHVGTADPHSQYLAKVPAPATLTYAATVDLDMTALAGAFRTITLTGNITFTTSNRSAGEMVTLRIVCDSTQRTLTFPVGWRFIGPKPANIAASKVAVLTVMLFGTADTDGVAAYGVES